jgi:hypothetical protein
MKVHAVTTFCIGLLLASCGGGGGGGGAGGGRDTVPSQSVGPDGATLQFDGGIVVEVPPGAVSAETSISAQSLETASVQPLLDESGNAQRHFVAGTRLEPSRQFSAPITVTLPLEGELADSWLPVHYQYDPEYNAYYPAPTSITVSPDDRTVTLTVSEFSDHVVAGVGGDLRHGCAEEEPCRCGRFTVVESSRDLVYSQSDCQASDIAGSITYHDCGPGGVTESWVMVEHTEGCVPKLTLAAEDAIIDPLGTTPIRATVTYLDDPVPGVTVDLSANDLIQIDPTISVTGDSGVVTATATAGNHEGVAPVNGVATWTYPSKIIAVNGVEQEVVERTKTMTAETQITVDVPAELRITIRPGTQGSFLTVNEQTQVEVAVLDYEDAQDRSQFSYVPGVVVNLEASAGVLGATQVTTLASGPATVAYTAPNTSGPVTINGTGTVETVAEGGDPRTYPVTGAGTIHVEPNADWVGSLSLAYTGCGAWADADLTQCIGYQFAFTVKVDLAIDVDDGNASPSLTDPNVSGTGAVTISSVTVTDGPLVVSDFTLPGCTVSEFQEVIDEARTFPFLVTVKGLQQENAFGTPYDLWLLFNHPSGGSQGLLLDIDARDNDYCDGVVLNTVVTPSIQQVYWNPGIVFEWDPDWSDDEGFRLDTTGRNIITQTGQCGSMYTGQYAGVGEGCTYNLTLTRIHPL